MREAVRSGAVPAEVEAQAAKRLANAGFEVDYAVVRDRELGVPPEGPGGRVALIAARLARTRLIDNLEFDA
jgi:pantoate--beta-alanine ligase